MLSRRTRTVWICFASAMTLLIVVLSFGESRRGRGFEIAAETSGISALERDPIFRISQPLDRERWTGIVIHHLGRPGGDPEGIARMHRSQGLNEAGGLGYHFVIGNGNGLGDGIIHLGTRWAQQLPGAHVAGDAGHYHNRHSIGICLVGNGDRRPFTDRQIKSLVSLIDRLQRQLELPHGSVRLCRDLVPGASSPGQYFPMVRLSEELPRLVAVD